MFFARGHVDSLKKVFGRFSYKISVERRYEASVKENSTHVKTARFHHWKAVVLGNGKSFFYVSRMNDDRSFPEHSERSTETRHLAGAIYFVSRNERVTAINSI